MRGRGNVILLVLAIALAAVLWVVFRLFFADNSPPYASELAAAFMGSLITAIITMVLLNRQSGAELLKERDVEILKHKIAVYDALTHRLEEIMDKGKVDLQDEIAIQILNQRLSFVADVEVLAKFNEFARLFSLVASDQKVGPYERTRLLDVLGELSVAIRKDLASPEDTRRERARYSEDDLKRLVMSNVNNLTTKTTVARFLEACSPEERGYFERLFATLESAGIAYEMGFRGFSISKFFQGYPTFGDNGHGIRLLMPQVPEEKREEVRDALAQATGRPPDELGGDETITFSVAELPVEVLIGVVKGVLAGEPMAAPTGK